MAVHYQAIGNRIRELRRQRGITQAQMAEDLELSDIHYGRIERGERSVSLDHLECIARLLDVGVADILDGAFPDEAARRACDDDENNYLESIAALMRGMNREKQQLMFDICYLIALQDHLR